MVNDDGFGGSASGRGQRRAERGAVDTTLSYAASKLKATLEHAGSRAALQHATPIQWSQTAVNVTLTPLQAYRSEVYLTQRRSDKIRAAHPLRGAAPKQPEQRHITQRCSDVLGAALGKAMPGRDVPSVLAIRRTPGCIYQSGVVLHKSRSA